MIIIIEVDISCIGGTVKVMMIVCQGHVFRNEFIDVNLCNIFALCNEYEVKVRKVIAVS